MLAVAGIKTRLVKPLHSAVGIASESAAWARLRDFAADKALDLQGAPPVEEDLF